MGNVFLLWKGVEEEPLWISLLSGVNRVDPLSSVSNVWGWGWAVPFLSADVNFALELSDLRHRHGFHIILVHKNQASEALLHHANELIRFEEFISDLPPRLPLKMPVSGFVSLLLYSAMRPWRCKTALNKRPPSPGEVVAWQWLASFWKRPGNFRFFSYRYPENW